VDSRIRRLVGWALVAIGVVVALVGAFADQLGLGGEGPDEFGGKQVAAVVVGVVVIALGLVGAWWPSGSDEVSDSEHADR
jgi:sulfite exporter TauE/SafE